MESMLKECFPVRNAPGQENAAAAEGTGVSKQSSVSRPGKATAKKRTARSTSTRECADDEQKAHSRQAMILQYPMPRMLWLDLIRKFIWAILKVYRHPIDHAAVFYAHSVASLAGIKEQCGEGCNL